jgi:hypothetical protein
MQKVLVGLLVVLGVAFAQLEQATLTGGVTDPTGAVVPGARVVARNVDTGVEVTTQTTQDGIYRIPYLHPGRYDVTAEAQGFKKSRVAGVILRVGLTATVDFQLEVGACSAK